MDPMEEIKETFFIECEELLETLEAGLISMSEGTDDSETVNAVFRAVHSIKGGAGAFSLDSLVAFSHKFENVLDLVRSEKLEPDPKVMDILLRSGDVLSDLVEAAREGNDGESDASRVLLQELKSLYSQDATDSPTSDEVVTPEPVAVADDDGEGDASFSAQPMSLDIDGPSEAEDDSYAPQPLAVDDKGHGDAGYQIVLKPHPELFAHGSEVTLLLRALSELGAYKSHAKDDNIPLLDDFDLSKDLLSFNITLETEQDETTIAEVFDFVDTECDLVIAPNDVRQAEPESSETTVDQSRDDSDRIPSVDVVASGSDSQDAVDLAQDQVTPQVTEEVKKEDKQTKQTNQQSSQSRATVRVDVNRVDRLVNLVGELVVTQAGITEQIERASDQNDPNANNALEEFKQLTRELQESVMSLRTQPVKPLFQRMQRISREAAAAAEKTVRLSLLGEATEVDKTVIERLSDPLTHMIRNAIDHGLEATEKRVEQGKDPVGVVTLSAAHRSGRVVIEVIDDGGGINRERVKAKAIEKGLIKADAQLSNTEIDHLLFAPGFSTAAEVTNLSGRGVGMDVVKRSIQALGGRISISSQAGQGTTFSISLPLTLAVLDGMIVRVDKHTVVVPLTAIVETHKPVNEQILEMGGEDVVLSIRGNLVPVVDVGLRFGYRQAVEDVTHHVAILIEAEDGQLVALIVDDIVDQRQVVIKGLDENYGEVAGIAAATILGDGTIALILDTEEMIAHSGGGSLQLGAVA